MYAFIHVFGPNDSITNVHVLNKAFHEKFLKPDSKKPSSVNVIDQKCRCKVSG